MNTENIPGLQSVEAAELSAEAAQEEEAFMKWQRYLEQRAGFRGFTKNHKTNQANTRRRVRQGRS